MTDRNLPTRSGRFARFRVPKWFGHAFALAATAIAFVAISRALRDGSDQIGDRIAAAHPAWAIAGVVLGSAAMMSIAAGWWRLLNDYHPLEPAEANPTRLEITYPVAASWYFAGEIGKYIPGGIWPVVGRGEIARRSGVSTERSYSSVVWSLLYLIGAGCAAALTFEAFIDRTWRPWSSAGIASFPLLLAGLNPTTIDRAIGLFPRLRERIRIPAWSVSLRLIAYMTLSWVLIGAANAAVAQSLRCNGNPFAIGIAAIAAWVAGTLAIGVPGGAGVREAVFMAICGLPHTQAVVVALASRLVFVTIDVAGFAFGAAAIRLRNRRKRESNDPDGSVTTPVKP